MFPVQRRQLLIFIFCGPAADFIAVLIDKPDSLWRDVFHIAPYPHRLRFRMFGAIKAPDSRVSEAAKIADMRLRRPKWKSFEDFRRARTAPRPDVFDKAASSSNVHASLPAGERHLIASRQESRVLKRNFRGNFLSRSAARAKRASRDPEESRRPAPAFEVLLQ